MKDRKNSTSAVAAPCVCEPVERTSRRWRGGPASGITGTHRADAIEQTRRWRGDDIKGRRVQTTGSARQNEHAADELFDTSSTTMGEPALHDVVDAVLPASRQPPYNRGTPRRPRLSSKYITSERVAISLRTLCVDVLTRVFTRTSGRPTTVKAFLRAPSPRTGPRS